MRKLFSLALLSFSLSMYSQSGILKGVVTDVNGEPLLGATIVIKGTNEGTTADFDGNFTLQNVPEGSSIVISYIGMKPKVVKVGKKNNIKIILEDDAVALDEVVAIGYGSQKKVNLTGAVSAVTGKEISKQPVSNVTNALVGRIPGLITKQTSGAPGADAASLSIRGYDSPLVIVDGVEQQFSSLNPNEIESISVLKDASAAIYGAKAGNGVILVTTKQGAEGKPKLTFQGSLTMQGRTVYPEPCNSWQYAELVREVEINDGKTSGFTFSPQDILDFYNGTDPIGHPNTDWNNETFKDWAPMQEYNMSLSGGTKDVKYFAFLGYLDQQGLARSGVNYYKRYNFRMNVAANVTKNLKASMNVSAIIGNLNDTNLGDMQLFRSTYDALPIYPSSWPDPEKVVNSGGNYNPVAEADPNIAGYVNKVTSTYKGILTLEYKFPFIKGLTAKAVGTYNQGTTESKNWDKQYIKYLYNQDTQTYDGGIKAGDNTTLTRSFNKVSTFTGQFSLNYNRTFAKKHKLGALLLFEFMDRDTYSMNATRSKYITDHIDELFAGSDEGQLSDGKRSETASASLVGRLNYNYNDRYLLETTFRYDGSPRFPANKRWGFFPGISLGWRISEESFIKDNISCISNLKLRASLAKSGRDDTGAFQYITGYKFSNLYYADDMLLPGVATTGLANPNITWEEMTSYNLGFDFGFFGNKLYGQFDVFYRLREGILAVRKRAMPNTFGAIIPDMNINSEDNRGVELSLGYSGTVSDFRYDISGNLGWARTKNRKVSEEVSDDGAIAKIESTSGRWKDVMIGYVFDGYFASQEEIDNLQSLQLDKTTGEWVMKPYDMDGKGNSTLRPGDIKYKDLNGDGKLSNYDREIIAYGKTPLITYGFNINTLYKNFALDIMFQGAAKYTAVVNTYDYTGQRNVPLVVYENMWTQDNPNPNAMFARQSTHGKNNKSYLSAYNLKDASYLRLKNIMLSYTFPKKIISKTGIDNLKLYISGTNLFTISSLMKNYQIDPEVADRQGSWSYPAQKTFSFGVQLTL